MVDNLSIVLLNYNNYGETIGCINRLKAIGVNEKSIIVVDNHSTDNSAIRLKEFKHDFEFIQSSRNGGYAFGNNIGINRAIKNKSNFICVINPDVYFKYNFLDLLVKELKKNKEIGVIGPCIRYLSNKKILSTGGTFNSYTGTPNFNYINSQYKRLGNIECDFIIGACMVFRTEYLEKVGLIPEDYFLNYEDNEWCNNFLKNGYKVVCDSNEFVFHKGESSIGKVSGLEEYFLMRNRVIFEKRNAKFIEKCFFYPYISLVILRNIILKRKIRYVLPYLDGFIGKNRYSYLLK